MFGECFDPKAEILVHEHYRPHWSQAGSVVFITFRTQDSIPREVIRRWDLEKQEWLRQHGIEKSGHWSSLIQVLSDKDRSAFKSRFNRCREEFLDTCHGRCLLKRPLLARVVADSLLHFDGKRYTMGDFIIMPNHVHLLAVFSAPEAMKEQCDSWLHYTAYRINKLTGESGKFWQEEPFDHLVRSPEQYEYLRKYIADNPSKACLRHGEYLYRRYEG